MSEAEQNYLWILEHQILPNQYALKRVALLRAIEVLKAAALHGSEAGPQEAREESMKLSLHRCKVCGTAWLLWPDAVHGGGWNLLDKYQRPGACCDNVAMGEQIEHLRDIPLTAPRQYPKSDPLGERSLRAIQEKFRKQDEEDCREAQDNTPSKGPFTS